MKPYQQINILHILFIIIIISCLLLINHYGTKFEIPPIIISKEESELKYNGPLIQVMNLGQLRLFSSLLWIQTLMDSDTEHYKQNDLNSWLYLRFNLITDIEPKFLAAYIFGGQYLSIIKDDSVGALDIYLKGLRNFHDNFDLNANIAFHYLFEMDLPQEAIQHYITASNHPSAPSSFKHLAARIASEYGNSKLSFEIIEPLYQRTERGSPLFNKYHNMLYAIKASMDLECLNKELKNCNTLDFDGNPYLRSGGQYRAKYEWQNPLVVKKRRK